MVYAFYQRIQAKLAFPNILLCEFLATAVPSLLSENHLEPLRTYLVVIQRGKTRTHTVTTTATATSGLGDDTRVGVSELQWLMQAVRHGCDTTLPGTCWALAPLADGCDTTHVIVLVVFFRGVPQGFYSTSQLAFL